MYCQCDSKSQVVERGDLMGKVKLFDHQQKALDVISGKNRVAFYLD